MADLIFQGAGSMRLTDVGDGSYTVRTALVVPVTGGPTLRTNAGFTAPGQTLKNYTGKQALSASLTTTITLETVTTGKIYIITDIYMTTDTATLVPDVQIQAAGIPIFRGVIKGDTAPISLPGMESQPNASSAQLVQIVVPAVVGPPNFYFFIGGFEQ